MQGEGGEGGRNREITCSTHHLSMVQGCESHVHVAVVALVLIVVLIFATVLVRAFQKSRAAEHQRMSLLPLQDDVGRSDLHRSNAS